MQPSRQSLQHPNPPPTFPPLNKQAPSTCPFSSSPKCNSIDVQIHQELSKRHLTLECNGQPLMMLLILCIKLIVCAGTRRRCT